jgi:hypothetical protein
MLLRHFNCASILHPTPGTYAKWCLLLNLPAVELKLSLYYIWRVLWAGQANTSRGPNLIYRTPSGARYSVSFRRVANFQDMNTVHNIVHLHPVAHHYFTFTFHASVFVQLVNVTSKKTMRNRHTEDRGTKEHEWLE